MKTLHDGRWRGDSPVPVPEGMATLTRKEAAERLGVDQRVITRYVQRGLLVKYVTDRDALNRPGAIVFDAARVAELHAARTGDTRPAPVPHPRRRW